MPPDKKGRKSSILKPPKVRNPLSDLDFKPSSDDDGITSEFTRSRRVSFSSKKGVALFTSDEGNTVWHNIYEEANKPDVSDSSSIATSNQTNGSTAASVYNDIELHENESPEESTSFDGASIHDMTFATFTSEEDHHCDDVGNMLKNLDKPTAFEISQPTFMDQTDALINYEINFESTAARITSSKTMSANPDGMPMRHDRSILFDKNDGGKLFNQHAALNPSSGNSSNVLINKENIDRKVLHCLMEDDIQNGETIPPRKRFASLFDQYQQDCINMNKIKDPAVARSSNLLDITDINQYNSVSGHINKDKSLMGNLSIISIIEESKRVHKNKKTVGNCPLASFDASLTTPMVFQNNKEKRQTIIFDRKESEGNMSITEVIPPVKNKTDNEREIKLFNQELPDFDMSITPINPLPMNKTGCNMSLTAVIPPIINKVNEKPSTNLHNHETLDFDMSMTSVIPPNTNKADEKRKTIIFNESMTDCNMSMTRIISPIANNKSSGRKTIVFNQEMPDCNMLITCGIPPLPDKTDQKRKTILYNEATPDCNMSMTCVIPQTTDKTHEKRKTIVFNQEMPDYNMSMTSVIPPIVHQVSENRKTIVFNQEMPGCNMSMTNVIPLIVDKVNEKRKTIVFNQEMPDCNMSMTSVIPPIVHQVSEKRKTIVFNQEMPGCNMSMTNVIPLIVDKVNEKRKTIVFNQEMPDCNMSMTSVIPPIVHQVSEKRKTIVFNQEMPDCNMSMTSVIPPIAHQINEKRKTIVFNQEMPNCNMSLTSVIPPVVDKVNEKRKTILFNQEMPDCNMSMTSVIPPIVYQISEKRKTIVFNQEMPDCNISMTSIIPPIVPKVTEKRKTIIYDQEMANSNMSMTRIISPIANNKSSKRKTIVFNQEMPDCNMSITCGIPPLADKVDQKRKTILYNEATPDCNMSMTCIIPQTIDKVHEKRKTIVFNQGMPDSNMSMTNVIPPILPKVNERRKTILFNQEMPDCNMSITSVIPPIVDKADDEKRKTIVYNEEMTDCNMSMTSVIPPIVYQVNEKRKTIIHNKEMPDCNISISAVIPDVINSNDKTRTVPINQEEQDCIIPLNCTTPPVVNEFAQRRKTILFNHEMLDSNMSMTAMIPQVVDKIDNKTKNIIFNPDKPDCNKSLAGTIPPIISDTGKRQMSDYDTSMSISTRLIIEDPEKNKLSNKDAINQVNTNFEQDKMIREPINKSITGMPVSQLELDYEPLHYDNIMKDNPPAKKKCKPAFESTHTKKVSLQCENSKMANVENEMTSNDMMSNISESEHFGEVIENDILTLGNDANPVCVFEDDRKSVADVSHVDSTTTMMGCADELINAMHESRCDSAMEVDVTPLSEELNMTEPVLQTAEIDFKCSDASSNNVNFSDYGNVNKKSLIEEKFSDMPLNFGSANTEVRITVDENCSKNETSKIIRNLEPLSFENLDLSIPEKSCGQSVDADRGVSIYQPSNDEYTKVLMMESERALQEKMHNQSVRNYRDEKFPSDAKNLECFLIDNLDSSQSKESRGQLADIDKSVAKLGFSIYQTSNEECTNVLMMESSRVLKMHDIYERSSNAEKLQESTIDLRINVDEKLGLPLNDKGDTTSTSIDIYTNDAINKDRYSSITDISEKEMVKSCTMNESIDCLSSNENVQKVISKTSCNVDVSGSNINDSNSVKQQFLDVTVNKSQTFNKSKYDSIFNKSDTKSLGMNALSRNESAIIIPKSEISHNTLYRTNNHNSTERLDLPENNSLVSLNVLNKEQIHLNSNQNKTVADNIDQSIDTYLPTDNMDSKLGSIMKENHRSIDFVDCDKNSAGTIERTSFTEKSKDGVASDSVDIYEVPNETREKRKTEDSSEASINKKIKTSMPVCSWLNDLKNNSHMESSVCYKDTNISANNINVTHKDSIYNGTIYNIDTTTCAFTKTDATFLPDDFDKPQMNETSGKSNITAHDFLMDISNNENIECDSIDDLVEDCHKSTDEYLENVSDLSLVNISLDKSDDGQLENNEDLQKLTTDSQKKLSVSGKTLNLSGSICNSIHTIIDPNDSRNASIVMPFEPPPDLVSIIGQIGLNVEDCIPENLDGNGWTFLLLRSAVRLIVKFGPSVTESRNLERVVLSIALEPIAKAKSLNVTHMFHPHAAKVMLHQLQSEELTSLCQISGDLPNLLRHCAQVSSAAREWSSDLYSLYINYDLQYHDDRFSFRIANGIARCIWQVDIKTHLLPFANSENIFVRVLHGSSPIREAAFKSVANKIRPNWVYIKNLAFGLHSVVKDFCGTLT